MRRVVETPGLLNGEPMYGGAHHVKEISKYIEGNHGGTHT
jgi:hypothetical protein